MNDRFPAAATGAATAGRRDFQHVACFYRGEDDYLAAVGGFVRAALARQEAVLLAVPTARAGPLREALAADAWRISFADMTVLGSNPARIIPGVRAFIDRQQGRPVSYVGEPAWPGRSAAELQEATRHEALVNRAFAGSPATILCPYDAAGLPPAVLADAERTHPVLSRGPDTRPSDAFLGPDRLPPSCDAPLPDPPPHAEILRYRTDLRPVRALVARWADAAGLPGDRAADLVLAVSELAANTLRHAAGSGTVAVWLAGPEIVCENRDRGWIADPLAGRQRPADDDAGGHGLWLVNQICDLAEMRTGPAGTTIRLHLRLPR